MVTAIITGINRFFFNLDSNVGKGQPNKFDDVEFVRFSYLAMRECNTSNPATLNYRLKMGSVLTNVRSTGEFGPDLDEAIRAHQAIRGGTQDGHISAVPASGALTMSYGPNQGWMMIALTNTIYDFMPDVFPRLDREPKCGPRLRESVQKIFVR